MRQESGIFKIVFGVKLVISVKTYGFIKGMGFIIQTKAL